MKWFSVPVVLSAVAIVFLGCRGADSQTPKAAPPAAQAKEIEAKVAANFAKLTPDDQKLAKAQKYCAIQNDERLGEMGAPIKVELKGQTIFLCCKSCLKTAQDSPDATIAKVEQLRTKVKGETK